MKYIRRILGAVIVWLDYLFSPRPIKRTPEKQQKVDEIAASMQLYQFERCPFCIKVRRTMKRLNLPIKTVDILTNKEKEKELIEKGGKRKVPCLKIQLPNGNFQWMYESSDIVKYLEDHFRNY